MEYISKVKIKNRDEEYDINDLKSIKQIICKYSGEKKDVFPNSEGVATVDIPVLQVATPERLGGVRVSKNIENSNITVDNNGYISSIVPLKKITDPVGNELKIDENTIQLPTAGSNTYGLVKIDNNKTVLFLDSGGYVNTKFGINGNTFFNIAIENEVINFKTLLSSFDTQEEE